MPVIFDQIPSNAVLNPITDVFVLLANRRSPLPSSFFLLKIPPGTNIPLRIVPPEAPPAQVDEKFISNWRYDNNSPGHWVEPDPFSLSAPPPPNFSSDASRRVFFSSPFLQPNVFPPLASCAPGLCPLRLSFRLNSCRAVTTPRASPR